MKEAIFEFIFYILLATCGVMLFNYCATNLFDVVQFIDDFLIIMGL